MLKKFLEEAGYVIAGEATNGAEAIKRYQELKPDLVTMDITMPDMDGLATVKAIRNMDPNAKIIMCSAMGQKTLVLEAIQSGAVDFIVKPFNNEKVIETIQKHAS
jgi:two-component system chemotaxis response regulator CheY